MAKFNKILKTIGNKIKKTSKLIPKPLLGLIFCMSILISPLLKENVFKGHDYAFHITNMQLTHKYIDIFKLNFLLPKIFGETIANGFGYGTGIFYPPLSYYLTSYTSYFLKPIGTNIYTSLNIIEMFSIIIAGIIMYLFLKRLFNDNKISSIGSISYISSTYFLCDIYTRTALGELLTFIFIPLVFWGLYELFFKDTSKFYPLFVVGYIGMIYSHLVLTLYLTLIILILFIIYYKKVFKIENIKRLIIASIIVLLITSPFTVPLIEHKLFGDYVVFEPNAMYADDEITSNTISVANLLAETTKKNNIKIYLNKAVFIIAVLVVILNKKIFNKDTKKIFKISILIVFISLIISNNYFPWEDMPDFLKMIQFPWRLRCITAFGLAVLAGNVVNIIKGENKTAIIIVIGLAITLCGFNSISFNYEREITPLNHMSMGVQSEYLPTKTKQYIIYFEARNKDIITYSGKTQIAIIKDEVPNLKATINLESQEATLELPRLYYLGYKITLTDNSGNKENINYYENSRGFIEIRLNKSGTLEVTYPKTVANRFVNYVSLITTIISIISLIYLKKQNRSK